MTLHVPAILLFVYLPVSVMTFVAYGWDKRRATRIGSRRISEQTLHAMELCGGWPGAIVAQRYFHHKWRKSSYMLAFWTIVVVHVVAWTLWFTR